MPRNRVTLTEGSVFQTTRGDAGFGQVFAFKSKKSNVNLREGRYMSLGQSDKLYSINALTGELSSTPLSGRNRPISIVGSFTVTVKPLKNGEVQSSFRGKLVPGDTFRIKRGGAEYVHVGELDDGRFMALNLDTQDYATTSKSDKQVILHGFASFAAQRVA